MPASYRPVDPHVSIPKLEAGILERWERDQIFERSMKAREGAAEWVFYDGPPTANNKPHIGHVEARTFKDIFCRFQTMRGHFVHRKAGWDCHGLPVEIEVEKELGITQKSEIEDRIGIEAFVERCRESVKRYVADWERLTSRIGFWIDLDQAYWTMTPDYVESVWAILRQIWDKGLLEEDFKVVPYCPRCETALSNHEQHQPGAYQTVSDPSVYVRFPLVDDPDTALLVWTTTPWTLLANMAAAVGPDIVYAVVVDPAAPAKKLIVARELADSLFGEGTVIERELPGRDLLDKRYSPPFPFVEPGPNGHTVRAGDFVSTEEGTGIVHLAPYGEDDMVVAKRDGLPILQAIDPTGHVIEQAGAFAGLWFKEADPRVVEDLENRGVLFRAEVYEHAYPHCWRCGTPLLYYARKDWYIRTSQIRDQLQTSNEATNWQPPTIKYGRFGDWLANNVDWSLSRDRYWGTPLPVWRCEDDHQTCVGSFAELRELSGRELEDFDPHRPHVDLIKFPCPECGKEATRVRAVIDAWFDSGSMPFAQWHYPFENKDIFEKRFPAHFITEAIDQTRGWFYSLLAVATLIEGENSYRNCVCLGLIVDAEGRKMSKSIGNVIDPWTVLDAQGADPLRWYLLTGGTPWSARRISVEIVQETLRKSLLTLWNTYSFWVTYAALEGFDPDTAAESAKSSELDRWILAELDDTIRIVTDGLEQFDTTLGGRRLERFVDDLSNWYVRRSRRRFWRSKEDSDTSAAFHTLWECLVTVAKLSAPFIPFISDEIYTNLTGEDSVHLADWPSPDDSRRDDDLRLRMGLARRIVGLGRAARTDAKVRVRQPLAQAYVVTPRDDAAGLNEVIDLIKEELNVKSIVPMESLGALVSYEVKPNFRALGPRFGSRVKDLAASLARADASSLVAELDSGGVATIDFEGERVELSRDDLDVRVGEHEEQTLVQDGPYAVALDLHLTPELVAEGIAREVVRAVQDFRKTSGLAVEDRIELWITADESDAAEALSKYEDYIAQEVLATSLHSAEEPPADVTAGSIEVDGTKIGFGLRKA